MLFAFVTAFQLRSSLDTVRRQRALDFYIPFTLAAFSNRIDDPFVSRGIRWGDELLSVNGRPFTGMSMYLRELWNAQHQDPRSPQWQPFSVTIRSNGNRIHREAVAFPHCTCGVPGEIEAFAIWLIPPMYCTIAGFVCVAIRPRAVLSWAFLALMLSLAQLQIAPDWYVEFQITSTPMLWPDSMRIAGVGYQSFIREAWPAALLVFSAYFFGVRRNANWAALLVALAFVGMAATKAILQIAWSENYRGFVSLYQFLESYRTTGIILGLAGASAVAWLMGRRYGLTVTTLGVLVLAGMYWSAPAITSGDSALLFVPRIPPFHNTQAVKELLFGVGCVAAGLVFFRRRVKPYEAVCFVLLLPLASDIVARWNVYRYPFVEQPFEHWPWFVLGTAGVALSGIGWSVVQRGGVARLFFGSH
jgi:hypothetical protein